MVTPSGGGDPVVYSGGFMRPPYSCRVLFRYPRSRWFAGGVFRLTYCVGFYFETLGGSGGPVVFSDGLVQQRDSEDEQWVGREDSISDEVFEKVMDLFEKHSYAQKRDQFTSEEIEELIASVSPVQDAKSVYDYWWEKRQRKGIPLIRQLQPPLWEIYQKRCREWEKQNLQSTMSPLSGSREKVSTAEDKPPMFAFCLKPRWLELLNKGSRHRPQKKISLSSQKDVSVDNSGGHHSSGKQKKGRKSVALNKLAAGGLDLDDLRAREALTTLKHARVKAKLMRERARKLMMSADEAVQKAAAVLMAAEAMKGSCTATGNDDPSTTS
ncbi:uncharacterized protein LOC143545533 [Bidens hawaiensis]|uniref:uncharacterized protein LOC143545533 n=1 Tax=Bidens hawaiensis TaxID=980011 RepID=UPI0040492903